MEHPNHPTWKVKSGLVTHRYRRRAGRNDVVRCSNYSCVRLRKQQHPGKRVWVLEPNRYGYSSHSWHFTCVTIKTCDGSEILSYLQANKLACHSFIHGGRLAGQRGSQVRDKGLYYSWFSRQLEVPVLIGNPLLSSPQEWWRGGPFWTLHT